MAKRKVDQYFTAKEVQSILKVSERTLERWMNEGLIEATEIPTGGAFGQPGTRFSGEAINQALTTKRPKFGILWKALQNRVSECVTKLTNIIQAAEFYQTEYRKANEVIKMVIDQNDDKALKAAQAHLDAQPDNTFDLTTELKIVQADLFGGLSMPDEYMDTKF